MKKVVIDVDVDAKGAVKGLDEINEGIQDIDSSTDDLQENTKGLTSSLDKMTGGLITGFKGVVSGVKKGILAMKSLKIAVAATGVGLLVLAFGALVTFFTKSQKGMDALSRAFAGFGAAVDVIIDRIIAVGEILSNIFNKPLKETLSGIGDEFKGIGDEIERDVKLAIELERATQKLRDLERGQSLAIAIQRKEIEKLRIESKDLTKTNEERVDSLERALFLEDFILQQQLTNQKERVRIARAEFDRANSTAADEQEFIEQKIRLVDLETESLRRQRTVITELESLKNQGRKDEEEGDRKRVEKIQTDLETELEIIQNTEDSKVDIVEGTQRRLQTLIKNQSEFEIFWASLTANQKLGIAKKTLNDLSTILGKETAAGKAAAIASTIIDTYQSATASYKSLAGIPIVGPALGAIAAAAAVAAGLENVRAITATPIPGGEAAASSVNASVPQVQTPQFNIVGSTSVNQLAESISQQTQQPVKTFVVAKDVTTQQELDRNTVSTATFGD